METPLGRRRTYNTMSMTPIPCRSPRGPPPLWLKNFKSQRVYLETPWVSTGIWWVSASCVCYALGFLRVSSKPPWVSTGICPFVLTFLWFCRGFSQVCLHCVFTSIWCCYRFAFDTLWICCTVRYALQAGMIDASVGVGLWVFLWTSCRFPLGFLQVFCGFPVGCF